MQKNSIPIGSMYDIFTRWWAFQICCSMFTAKIGEDAPIFYYLFKGVGEKPPTSLPLFTSPKSTIHGLVKGSLDEKLPSYELLKMLRETDQ